MALGKSIRIYLDGGDVSGIRYAELVNWTGQALLCPRSRLGELVNWSEYLKRPGIYFLIGAEKTTTREVYIGESESVFNRLQQHIEKEFWQEAVVFTSKDENLTKSHIKFLESRLVAVATDAGRYEVKNGNTPTPSGLPRPDKDAMEEFLVHLRLLLGALGHRLLEPLVELSAAKPKSAAMRFTCAMKDAVAHGMVTDDGFVVLKGSTALAQMNPSLGAYTPLKAALIGSKKLTPVSDDLLEFAEDILFTSASAAAATITGSATNGRVAWRNTDGRTLKELEEAQTTVE